MIHLKNGESMKIDRLFPSQYFDIDEEKTIKSEEHLQEIVVRFFRSFIAVQPEYSNCLLIVNPLSDFGVLSGKDVGKAKRLGLEKANPDLIFIFKKDNRGNGGFPMFYCGLAMELKTLKSKDLNKDLKPIKKHSRDQQEKLVNLIDQGYSASFSVGIKQSLTLMIEYFTGGSVLDFLIRLNADTLFT